MQNTLNFKDTLIKEAGLLSLTKSDCDLFILAQANTLTYQQLSVRKLLQRYESSGMETCQSATGITFCMEMNGGSLVSCLNAGNSL